MSVGEWYFWGFQTVVAVALFVLAVARSRRIRTSRIERETK